MEIAKQYIINILNFMQQFPDNLFCTINLREQREQSNIVYKHCYYKGCC